MRNRKLVMLTFESCAPCKRALPIVEKVASERETGLEIVDIFDDKERFKSLGGSDRFYVFPTTCISNGDELGPCIQGIGQNYEDDLKELMEEENGM